MDKLWSANTEPKMLLLTLSTIQTVTLILNDRAAYLREQKYWLRTCLSCFEIVFQENSYLYIFNTQTLNELSKDAWIALYKSANISMPKTHSLNDINQTLALDVCISCQRPSCVCAQKHTLSWFETCSKGPYSAGVSFLKNIAIIGRSRLAESSRAHLALYSTKSWQLHLQS